MHTNEQFIKALNRKKEEAFQMLFKDYYASLVMYAMHYVRQEVAEDIVQDLMTLLWEKDTYFDSISAFHSFIYLFIRNRSINHLKHQKWPTRWKQPPARSTNIPRKASARSSTSSSTVRWLKVSSRNVLSPSATSPWPKWCSQNV